MREFLYVYVHEIGHAFNLVHSWDKGRPESLSWMNNPIYQTDFWDNFRFRFDDEELIHLRHGDRSSIIPGGEFWGSGTHLDTASCALTDSDDRMPVELLLRSKERFEFMEPVIIEMRLKNKTKTPIKVNPQLNPDFGYVTIFIRRPSGNIVRFTPVKDVIADIKLKRLESKGEGIEGEDRCSVNVQISYGADGHHFKEPGEYQLKALYHGTENILIPSNLLRINIGRPMTKDDEQIGKKFFTHEAGMALYLKGSDSKFLKNGMDTLRSMSEKYEESPVGAQITTALAKNLSRPFHRIINGKVVRVRQAKPREVIKLIDKSLKQQQRDDKTLQNITYEDVVILKANQFAKIGEKEKARLELVELAKYLKPRGVNPVVINRIEDYSKKI